MGRVKIPESGFTSLTEIFPGPENKIILNYVKMKWAVTKALL